MIKRLFLALLLSLSMLLTACSEKAQYKETKVFMLNYVHSYNNLGSLVENSEKIAVVRVMDEGTYEADTTACEEMPELNVSPVVLTVHKVKVIKPLYNCEKGDVIEHIQMGGIYENVLYQEYNGSGFLEKGKEYLLFMIEDNGRYIEMNDAAGRCVIENGKVTSVHYDPEKEQTDVYGFHKVDLDEVIEKIKFIQSLPEPGGTGRENKKSPILHD